MPALAEHLYKARNNASFAEKLDSNCDTSTGWALVALFYSAMHYVEGHCAESGQHHEKHNEITDHIRASVELQPIRYEYRDLSTFGWNARYMPVKYGPTQLQEAKKCHLAVKAHIENLLPKQMPIAPSLSKLTVPPTASAPQEDPSVVSKN